MTPENNDIFQSCYGDLTIIRRLGKGKAGFSYLAQHRAGNVVLKLMHNESSVYYNMPDDRIGAEISAYSRLKTLGMPVPKLLCFDTEKQYLVKDYIEGETAAEWIARGGDVENAVPQLMWMAAKLARHDLNMDYFPTNFVWTGKKLYYIDYEVNAYSKEWDLFNWGLYYWANGRGFNRFFQTGDARCINSDTSRGIPIKAPFEAKIKDWYHKYAE